MKPLRQRRLIFVMLLLGCSVFVVFLVTQALRENINLFYTPSEALQGVLKKGTRIRVGGMVKMGSVVRGENLEVLFILQDFPKVNSLSTFGERPDEPWLDSELQVNFNGILPDLFKEGQGIVTTGVLGSDGIFKADEVLAKHDENYTPPQILGERSK